ncbi:TIGR03086 family metal-binding protein [Yinghuangia soli]|uniref:TIGR03086 family metal-binding protein n=1 Tax=Yinghuangia soli TaxID=2908204 RepID=A0AA41PVB5_9ACTN|nr:TIGR03086 family metal-binding protein [Yinghuangia soli]MCF2526282.1 TIGR03086 family metal-binding protein [Yinghuangia soli]
MPIKLDAVKWYDARTVKAGVAVVEQVTADDLDKPTPCTGWSLADLLAHMTAQHRGFAAAARGDGADPRHWATEPPSIAQYREAAADVFAAFGEVTDREQDFMLPEITSAMPFPAWQAIGFHFIDYVVHAWDVARTLGLPHAPEPDIAEAALPIALAVPDGPSRLAPGAAFAPPLPPVPARPAPRGSRGTSAGTAPFAEILRALGRNPAWSPTNR